MASSYTEEQARVAVAEAVLAVRELRDVVARTVPEASRGRAQIIAACDEALAAVGDAVRGDAIGDDRPALWRRALDAGRRAVERADRFAREVGRTTRERLARLWRVGVEVAQATKRAIENEVQRQIDVAKRAVQAAATILAGFVAASAGVMFSGWVVLAAAAILYFSNKD
jgi:hypothetical protein